MGPLGSGLGGGVELTVANLIKVLHRRGHQIAVVTPAGAKRSAVGIAPEAVEIIQVPGSLQPTAQTQGRDAPVVTSEALSNAWDYAQRYQSEYDLLVNFAYDWLPFSLTAQLTTPVAHFVSMGSLSDRLDEAIAQTADQFPGTLAAYTHAQVNTFAACCPLSQWKILGCGLNLSQYEYRPQPGKALAWVGRISPEKGLEDAIAAALKARQPLNIFGKMEDGAYWQSLQFQIGQAAREAPITYCGFLPTDALQKRLGHCRALLVTPHWVEAFGIVAIEALACGVPVIAYRDGGLVEIVCDGRTGWLVTPGDVDGLVSAISKVDAINRADCRAQAEKYYGLERWGQRFEQWFYKIVLNTPRP
ncbi:MAG: glycosyltransferase [Cyanobacteria bacterium J06560_2]